MDLVEENRRITPRDYLELALRPVQGGGKDIASKNEVLFGSYFIYSDDFTRGFTYKKKEY